MSFLYPRTIAVTRPAAQTGVGFQSAYAADQAATETPVATGLRASIQVKREGQKNPVALPGDGNAPYWDIFIPRRDAVNGLIKQRDIITDDLGERYQVSANYWDSLGYRLRAMKLEA